LENNTVVNYSLYSFGDIFTKASSFFLIPVYLHFLSPADYGILSIILIFQGIFYILGSLGLDSGIWGYFDFENNNTNISLISSSFIVIITFSFILTIIFYLLTNKLANIFSLDIISNNDFILLAFSFFMDIPGNSVLSIFKLKKLAKTYVIWNLSFSLFRIFLLIIFVAILKLGLHGIILGLFFSSLIRIFSLISIREYFAFIFNLHLLKKAFFYGFPFVFDSLFFLLFGLSDRYFINHFISMSKVGIYNLGIQFSSVLLIFTLNPFQSVYTPTVYSFKSPENNNEYFKAYFRYFISISMIVILLISFFSKDVIQLISHKSAYSEVYKLIPILLVGYFFFGLSLPASVGWLIRRKSKGLPIIMLIALIIDILANLIFTPQYGIYGAAISIGISYFVIFSIKYYLGQKYYKINFNLNNLFGLLFIVISFLVVDIIIEIYLTLYLALLIKIFLIITVTYFIYYKYLHNADRANITKHIQNIYSKLNLAILRK